MILEVGHQDLEIVARFGVVVAEPPPTWVGFFPQSKEGKSPLHMAAIHGRFTRSQILIQNGQWGLPGLIPVFSWRFHNLLAAQGGGVKAVPVLTQTRCVAVASRPPLPVLGGIP